MKQLPKHNFIFFKFIILFYMILFCFTACNVRAEQNSLTGYFETIDALISLNQNKEAAKEIKKIEKKAYDSWSYIGIYKRYLSMSNDFGAEKILKKALKKNSENIELITVYSKFLIDRDRLNDAEKIAKKLKGTKYGSVYSEVVFKKAFLNAEKDGESAFFNDESLYDIYLDAYSGTRNPVWLRNCAVFNLRKGMYEKAAGICPYVYANAEDAYFWALVLYDAGKYMDAISAAESAKKYLNGYKTKTSTLTSNVKLVALESDAYMALSDMESAEKIRSEIVINIDSIKANKSDNELLPVIMTNSAIFADRQGLDEYCADMLFYSVNRWPDYVPALILYSDFAYRSNLEREEDLEMQALRKAGIKTLGMEKYDARRKIPMSDALYRLDEAIKNNPDPYLLITKLDLKYKTERNFSEKEKNRDLWNMIENNYYNNPSYRSLLIQYSLNYLLRTKQIDEAWGLFQRYIYDLYGFESSHDFWEQYLTVLHITDLSINDFAAWFATQFKLKAETFRIYEYCVYESGGVIGDGEISPVASNISCINLADIYFSNGQVEKALELYGKAVGREISSKTRSDIFYRIASVYASIEDKKNALRSVDYAHSLNPENAKASVLKDKLK